MDTKQITYILTIAQEGGISKAAGKLFVTQSALDQQLLKLESELGTQLFCRAHGTLSLTEAGEVYVKYAKKMLSLKNEAYHIIHDVAAQKRGQLSLAFAPERGMEMFAHIYPRFYEEYSEVQVIPREIGVKRQIQMLQNDELDLGFISHRDTQFPNLSCCPLFQEEFVLIAPKTGALAQYYTEGAALPELDSVLLKELTFSLMYKESTQRDVIDPIFEKLNVKPKLFLETASNRANISMVQQGICCSIVPFHYVKDDDSVLRFSLAGHPSWSVSACYRKGGYVSQAAKYFIRLAEEYLAQQNLATGLEFNRLHG